MRVLFVAIALCCAVSAQENVVKTSLGVVQGTVKPTNREFRGIPFAAPPVGSGRWMSPGAVKPWSSPLMATADAPGCMQDCVLPSNACPPKISEDCLYLNIFTPRTEHMATPRPVMVFIHGGNFKQGYAGGLLYDAGHFANNTNTVIVTIQYRLGALGFGYSGDSITGNYGLQDQRAAFDFVSKHIAAFGGNPDSITAFGQSAGAMSIAAHMSSPESVGLFKNAIMESEPFGLPFRDSKSWGSFFPAFAKDAGCEGKGDACLRGLDADTLIAAQVKAETDLLGNIGHILQVFLPWTPTVGVSELPLPPWDAFVRNLTHSVPYMIGTVQNEGWTFVYEAYRTKPLSKFDYGLLLDLVFGLSHHHDIVHQYPSNDQDNRPAASKLATDALFACATRNATLSGPVAHSTAPVWVYHFDHVMSFSKALWGPNYTFCDDKVCHAEELAMVFGNQDAALNVTFTPGEVELSNNMQAYWANFAQTSDPNTGGNKPSIPWPKYDAAQEAVLKFETPDDVVEDAPFKTTCQLWDSFGYNFA